MILFTFREDLAIPSGIERFRRQSLQITVSNWSFHLITIFFFLSTKCWALLHATHPYSTLIIAPHTQLLVIHFPLLMSFLHYNAKRMGTKPISQFLMMVFRSHALTLFTSSFNRLIEIRPRPNVFLYIHCIAWKDIDFKDEIWYFSKKREMFNEWKSKQMIDWLMILFGSSTFQRKFTAPCDSFFLDMIFSSEAILFCVARQFRIFTFNCASWPITLFD